MIAALIGFICCSIAVVVCGLLIVRYFGEDET